MNRCVRALGQYAPAAVLLALVILSGCATQVNSPSQSVLFLSEPPGAQVIVDDRLYVTTPGKVSLSRLSPHIAQIQKDGYEPARVEVTRGMSWWVFGDLVCLVFLPKCVSKDLQRGGFYVFDDEVEVELTRTALSKSPPSTAH